MPDPGKQQRQIKRLLIVLAVVFVLCGGLFALYQINSGQRDQVSDEQIIADARAAFADNDYDVVVDLLENPASRNTTRLAIKDDAELLSMYVTARLAIPMYEGRHLSRVIAPLTDLIKLDPDNAEHGHTLLDALLTLDRNTEALKHAQQLSTAHPQDTKLLRQLAQAQHRKGKTDDAIDTLSKAIEVEPLHVPTHAQQIELIKAYDQPTDAFTARVEQVYADHATDPRAMMIRSLAQEAQGNGVQARDLLRQASAVPPANQDMVPLLTRWLDRAGMYAQAMQYLKQHAEAGIQSPAGRLAVYRAFESGNHQAILDRLKDSDPAEASTDLLGMWASAYRHAGSLDQAEPVLNELKNRNNAIAATWLMLIDLDQQAKTQPAQIIDPIMAMVQSDEDPLIQAMAQRHPYLMQRLGEAYLEAEEPETALSAFMVAARNTDSWSRPYHALAQTLLKLDQPQAALTHAREAERRDDRDTPNEWRWIAQARTADPADATAVEQLLEDYAKLADDASQQQDALPTLVELLALADRTDQAKQQIAAALGEDNALSTDTLSALFSVSAWHSLGLEEQIASRFESQFDATPAFELFQASTLETAERTKRLIDLAEQYPDDLTLQITALQANQPDAVGERFHACIDRLRTLAGESSIHWRLQQARIAMQSPEDEPLIQQSIEQLSHARTLAPMHLELCFTLSRCYMLLDNHQAAADTALAAKTIAPRHPQAMLLHGMALHRLNQSEASRLDLIPLALNPDAATELRHQACFMLHEQGETVSAQQAIEQMWSVKQVNNQLLTILAKIYSGQGDVQRADVVCKELTRVPDLQTIRFVSTYYHQTNRPELAKQAIQASQAAGLQEADLLMLRSEDAAQSGQYEAALQLIEQAAKADASQAHRWHTAVQLALSLSRPDEAIRFTKLGLASIPSEPGLTNLAKHADLIKQAEEDASLTPMAVTILNLDPYHEQAVRTLQITQELGQTKAAASELAALVNEYPEFKFLSELTCDRLLQAGMNEQAYPLAKSTMTRFPDSGVAARVATLAAFRLQEWTILLSTATAWAERTPQDRMNADLMRAAAMNQLERFSTATKLLQPYILAQDKLDDSNQLMFEHYTAALVKQGEAAQAFGILKPHLGTSPQARSIALRRVNDDLQAPDTANEWIQAVSASSGDNIQNQFQIVAATFLAGQRLNHVPLIKQADQAVNKLLNTTGPMSVDIHYAKGQIAQRLGSIEQAIASYQNVLKQVPDNPQVLNNLALVLLEQGGSSVAEAETLALRATTLAKEDPNLLDTLAVIYLRVGKLDQAMQAINQAIDLEPINPAWYITQADIYEAMGDTDRASLLRERYKPRLQN